MIRRRKIIRTYIINYTFEVLVLRSTFAFKGSFGLDAAALKGNKHEQKYFPHYTQQHPVFLWQFDLLLIPGQ